MAAAGAFAGRQALLHGNGCRQCIDDHLEFARFNDGVVFRTKEGEITDWNVKREGSLFTGLEFDPGEGCLLYTSPSPRD